MSSNNKDTISSTTNESSSDNTNNNNTNNNKKGFSFISFDDASSVSFPESSVAASSSVPPDSPSSSKKSSVRHDDETVPVNNTRNHAELESLLRDLDRIPTNPKIQPPQPQPQQPPTKRPPRLPPTHNNNNSSNNNNKKNNSNDASSPKRASRGMTAISQREVLANEAKYINNDTFSPDGAAMVGSAATTMKSPGNNSFSSPRTSTSTTTSDVANKVRSRASGGQQALPLTTASPLSSSSDTASKRRARMGRSSGGCDDIKPGAVAVLPFMEDSTGSSSQFSTTSEPLSSSAAATVRSSRRSQKQQEQRDSTSSAASAPAVVGGSRTNNSNQQQHPFVSPDRAVKRRITPTNNNPKPGFTAVPFLPDDDDDDDIRGTTNNNARRQDEALRHKEALLLQQTTTQQPSTREEEEEKKLKSVDKKEKSASQGSSNPGALPSNDNNNNNNAARQDQALRHKEALLLQQQQQPTQPSPPLESGEKKYSGTQGTVSTPGSTSSSTPNNNSAASQDRALRQKEELLQQQTGPIRQKLPSESKDDDDYDNGSSDDDSSVEAPGATFVTSAICSSPDHRAEAESIEVSNAEGLLGEEFTSLAEVEDGLVTAQPYDQEARRAEVEQEARRNAEARLQATTVSAEAVVIKDDEPDFNRKKRIYCMVGLLMFIVVVVLVAVFVSQKNKNASADPPPNMLCSTALNMTVGTSRQGVIDETAGIEEGKCQVEKEAGFGLWYYIEGDGSGIIASTCEGSDLDPNSDTQIIVYSGSCDDDNNNMICIGDTDQLCGDHGAVGWTAEKDTRYYILVKGFRQASEGRFTLSIDSLDDNSECETASKVESSQSPIFGSTRNLPIDDSIPSCGSTGVVSAGSWYEMEGDGNVQCASALGDDGVITPFPLQVSVLSGDACSDLTCVGKVGPKVEESKNSPSTSDIGWYAEAGISYYMFVQGEKEGSEGDFQLNLRIAPPNGICPEAEQLGFGEEVVGTLENACNEDVQPSCPSRAAKSLPGVWYTVNGTGLLYAATTFGLRCADPTRISVFAGSDCSALECVDFFSVPCDDISDSVVSTQWFSYPGVVYYILVQSSEDASSFTMIVEEATIEDSDRCEEAVEIDPLEDGWVLGDTSDSLSNDPGGCLGFNTSGVFYSVQGTGNTLKASTCNPFTTYSTDVTILTGGCGQLQCVPAKVISCDGIRSIALWPSELGQLYYIYVNGSPDAELDAGLFNLTVTEGGIDVSNDFCATAESLEISSQTTGATSLATQDIEDTCGIVSGSSPGVWYELQGQGAIVTASLCGDETDYDTQIFVYNGSCGSLTCVAANDDITDGSCPQSRSKVSFMAEEGENYYILVSGFEAVGNFELTLV